MMCLIAGISDGSKRKTDHCGKCGIELPQLWDEGFCSIRCFQKEDK